VPEDTSVLSEEARGADDKEEIVNMSVKMNTSISPFAENIDRKFGNKCKEFLLPTSPRLRWTSRRDFAPDETLERNHDCKVVGASFFMGIEVL